MLKPLKTGDKGRLLSPTYSDTTGECVRFWYHMFGKDVGKLRVFAHDLLTKLDSQTSWERSGKSLPHFL